jgi:hypothetical protein
LELVDGIAVPEVDDHEATLSGFEIEKTRRLEGIEAKNRPDDI